MADAGDALLAWLSGDVRGFMREQRKVKKLYREKADTSSNEDEESADYIPMEKVSRAFIDRQEMFEKKKLNDEIDYSLGAKKRPTLKPAEDAESVFESSDSQMSDVSKKYLREQEKVKDAKERQQMNDSITGRQRDADGNIVKPEKAVAEDTPEPAMEDVANAYLKEQDKVRSSQQRQQMQDAILGRVRDANGKIVKGSKPTTDSQVEAANPEIAKQERENPTPQQASLIVEDQPKPASVFESLDVVPQPDSPAQSFVSDPKQANNLPMQTGSDASVGTKGPLSELEVDPASAKFDPNKADYSDLSSDFKAATSKDISVLGMQVPKGGAAYDVADATSRGLASANSAIFTLPIVARRVGAYLYKPIDAVAGTHAFEAHNQTTDQLDNFLRRNSIIKEPENFYERTAQAIGAAILPFPGLAATKAGQSTAKAVMAEAFLPGTIIRPGESAAKAYAISVPASVGINEGLYRTLEKVDELRKTNPPVPNSKGDVEPRVLSVDGTEAKRIQQQADAERGQFIPQYAEGNYGNAIFLSIAGIAGLALAARGGGRMLGRAVEGKTIRDPANPIPDLTPPSSGTASETLRTLGQDSTHIIQSTAARAGNDELAQAATTQTRAGQNARMEYMHDTGAVELPNWQYQLTTSPASLADEFVGLPAHRQQDMDWAFATLDQMDHATVNGRAANAGQAANGPGMPAQADIQRAQQILGAAENAPYVRAMNEMREAIIGAQVASGRLSAQAGADLRLQRPNYSHVIETGEYVVENGVSRPMTRREQWASAWQSRNKPRVDPREGPEDLSLARERTQISGPNQRLSPMLSNIIALREAVEFGLNNDIRTRLADTITSNPDYAHTFTRYTGNSNRPPHNSAFVDVWRNGERERYTTNPLLAEALDFDPLKTQRTLATIRNVSQSLITGVAAPWYAVTSAVMEGSIGTVTRMRGTRLGYVDQVMQALTNGRVAIPGDLLGTALSAINAGLGAVRADFINSATKATERAILDNPNLMVNQVADAIQATSMIPGKGAAFVRQLSQGIAVGQNVVAQDLVDNGRRLYAGTAKGFGNRTGALHSSSNEMMRNVNEFNSQNMRDAFLRELGAEQGNRLYQVGRHYMQQVSNVHDLVKLAYINQNRGRIPDTALAHETRNLGGDLGKRGLGLGDAGYNLADDVGPIGRAVTGVATNPAVGGAYDLVRDSTNYFNPHIQGVTRVAEALRRDPAVVTGGIIMGVTMPYVASLAAAHAFGPEYVDYLLNKREEYKKTNYVYWPVPGKRPEDGFNMRIDPALSAAGYPVLEALDSVFGIRKMNAAQMNREVLPQEIQGTASALLDGLKEFVNIGYPLPMQAVMGASSVSARGPLEPAYNRKTEQSSGAQGSGQYSSSVLSQGTQMALESIVGVVGKAAIHSIDAYAGADGKSGFEGKIGAATTQFRNDISKQIPFFGGRQSYNASSSVLSKTTRDQLQAAKKIITAIDVENANLLKVKTNDDYSDYAVPNLKQGYVGEVEIPDDVKQQYQVVKEFAGASGELESYKQERKWISDNLQGLRGVNAGNLGRHVIVQYKPEFVKSGVEYAIVQRDLLKKESVAEQFALDNPTLTPKTGKVAANSRQRPRPVEDVTGKILDPRDIKGLKSPTLDQVQELQNMMNMRRIDMDREAAASVNELEKKAGMSLKDLAAKIKLRVGGKDYVSNDD